MTKRRITEVYELEEDDLVNLYNTKKRNKKELANNIILDIYYDNKYKFRSINNTFLELSFIDNINICNINYILYNECILNINVCGILLTITNFDFMAFYINNIYENIINHDNDFNNEQKIKNQNFLLNLLYNIKKLNDIDKINKLKNSEYTKYKNIYNIYNM